MSNEIQDLAHPAYIIMSSTTIPIIIMEAEQLNHIANQLVDIAQRADELRRYL